MWKRRNCCIISVVVCVSFVVGQYVLHRTFGISLVSRGYFKSAVQTGRKPHERYTAVNDTNGEKVDHKLYSVGNEGNRSLEWNVTTHVKAISENASGADGRINGKIFYNLTGMFFKTGLSSFLEKSKDPHPEYNFTIIPWNRNDTKKYENGSWSLVVNIESANGNKLRRQAIRETWTSDKAREVINIIHFFIVGSTNNENVQRDLVNENNLHGDILQLDKEDIYRHVTHKSLAAIQWSSTNFPPHWIHAISGDDVFLDVEKFRDEMQEIIAERRRQLENIYSSNHISHESVLKELPIYCTCMFNRNSPAIRNKNHKYYISESEYPFDRYPPYCSGPFYTLPIQKAAILLERSRYLDYCWMEDAWIVGVVRLLDQTENGVLLSESESR